MSNIDADALERAAKAARQVEKSKYAREIFKMSREESVTKQQEERTKQEEAKAQAAAYAKDAERIRWEEQRKTIEFNAQTQSQRAQQDHELAQQRQAREHEMARDRQKELVQMQLQSEARKQAMRRAADAEIQQERRRTDEHRAALERENMSARIMAEAEGRIKESRENQDLIREQLKLKGEQDRLRVKQAIDATFEHLGSGISAFLGDRQRITTTVLSLTALAAGVYVTREGVRVAGRFIERRLGTPALVRETSRTTNQFGRMRQLRRMVGLEKPEGFKDVVLEPALETRVSRLVKSTTNTVKNNAPFRHMLLYGPPGTGKTMMAKRLARNSGMDYAIMSGGDVGPLGADAVTQLHKLFDWSETSSRGLLIFVDEADAFLASRSRTQMSENQRNALNALLYRTGDASTRFMLVLATNRPGDLDAAINDRVDESVLFGLPDVESRKRLVQLYFEKYILNAGENKQKGLRGMFGKGPTKITVASSIDYDYLDDLAVRLEDFSGRAISKLMISLQGAVYGSADALLTMELMEEVVATKMLEHERAAGGFEDYAATGFSGTSSGVVVEALPDKA